MLYLFKSLRHFYRSAWAYFSCLNYVFWSSYGRLCCSSVTAESEICMGRRHNSIFSDCHVPSYPVWMDLMLLIHSEQVEDYIKVLGKGSHSNFRICQIKLGEKSLREHKIIHKQDQKNYNILFHPKKHFFC